METNDSSPAARDEVPKLQPIRSPFSLTAVSVFGLLILALLYTVYFAKEFLLPITLAWILALILKPLVRLIGRTRIPQPLVALMLLLSVRVLFFLIVFSVSGPA